MCFSHQAVPVVAVASKSSAPRDESGSAKVSVLRSTSVRVADLTCVKGGGGGGGGTGTVFRSSRMSPLTLQFAAAEKTATGV